MGEDVLGGEDAAWLHMEAPDNPMVVDAFLDLAGPLPSRDVAALVSRLAEIPRFRTRLAPVSGRFGVDRWEPADDFRVEDHVEYVTLPAGGDEALRAFVGRSVSGLLDPSRPLWKIYVIDRPGAGTTLLCRVHHAIADGFALLGVLLSLCDEESAAAPVGGHRRPALDYGKLDYARSLARLVALPPDPKTLLKRPLGARKRVAWSSAMPLASVKDIARASGATVNDVLVAVAAGALGRYLSRRGEPTHGLELRAMVPVDLRHGEVASALGNRFGLVVLGLPVGMGDSRRRLSAITERMTRLKRSPEALVAHALLSSMGWAPRLVEAMAVRFFGAKASLVLTNVPGPKTRLRIAGVPVSRVMFWVPEAARMGLGISIFSYAGDVTIGVMSDAAVVPDPDALVADVERELVELRRLAGGRVPVPAAVAV